MKQANLTDYILLTLLSIIWASAFFNIKIAKKGGGSALIKDRKLAIELVKNVVKAVRVLSLIHI